MLCTWFITSSTLCGLTMIHWWIICLGFRGKAFGAESLGVHTTRHSAQAMVHPRRIGILGLLIICPVILILWICVKYMEWQWMTWVFRIHQHFPGSLFEIFQITNLGWLFGLLWFWWIHPAPVAVPVSYAVEQRKEMFAPIAVNCQMYAVRHSENFKMGLEQITPRLCRDWWFLVRLVNPLIGFQLWY